MMKRPTLVPIVNLRNLNSNSISGTTSRKNFSLDYKTQVLEEINKTFKDNNIKFNDREKADSFHFMPVN